MLGYLTNKKPPRQLNKNQAFERIIKAVVGDGYVYSNSNLAYMPTNGTKVLEYIKKVDDITSLNYLGPLTYEQSQEINLPSNDNNYLTLLSYLIKYQHTTSKLNNVELLETLEYLIENKAIFNVDDIKIAAKCNINIVEIWERVNNTKLSQANFCELIIAINTAYVANEKQFKSYRDALLYSFFKSQPVVSIYNEVLTNKEIVVHYPNAIELCLEAFNDLLKTKSEKYNRLSGQIKPYSALPSSEEKAKALDSFAEIINESTLISSEIPKLKYAVNELNIRIIANKLLTDEQSLVNQLEQLKNQQDIIDSFTVQQSELKSIIEQHKLEDKKQEQINNELSINFSNNWPNGMKLNGAQIMNRNSNSKLIADKLEDNLKLKQRIAEEEISLEKYKKSLGIEIDKLNSISSEIRSKNKSAQSIANDYNANVEERKTLERFGSISDYTPLTITDLEKHCRSTNDFLNQICITKLTTNGMIGSIIVHKKWELLTTVFKNGFDISQIKTDHGGNALHALASTLYNGHAEEPIWPLVFFHLNNTLVTEKDDCGNTPLIIAEKYIDNTLSFSYIRKLSGSKFSLNV